MNLKMGSQHFADVEIPLLWGTRAVLQDRKGRLSVVDLSEPQARLEVLGDEPAPGVEFEPTADGFTVMRSGQSLYAYNPTGHSLHGISLKLPDCHVTPSGIHIGTMYFGNNAVIGFAVGMAVSENGFSMGSPLPPGLAKLVV